MALSRSLLWLSPSISAAPAATERPRIHFLHTFNPKQNAGLFWALPWTSRALRSRRILRGQVQVASVQANGAKGQVEALPSNELTGEEGGQLLIPESEGPSKPRRRRRKTKKKKDEETTSSSVTLKENVEKSLLANVAKSDSLGTTLKSNSQEVVVDPSLEFNVARSDSGDATAAQKSSSYPSSREVPELQAAGRAVNGATGGVGTGSSGTGEIELDPEGTRKKNPRRSSRSKKTKQGAVISNETIKAFSGLESETEPAGRIFTDEELADEVSTPAPKGGPVALKITGAPLESNSDNGEESGSGVKTKRKKRSKKKPVNDQERRQANGSSELQNSSGSGADVAVTESLEILGSESSEGEEQAGTQGSNGQGSPKGSPKIRKKGRRKKTVGMAGTREQGKIGTEDGEGSSGSLGSQFSQGVLRDNDKSHHDGKPKEVMLVPLVNTVGVETDFNSSISTDDEVRGAEGEGSQQHDNYPNKLQFNGEESSTSFQQTRSNSQAGEPKDGSGSGTVVSASVEVMNKILAVSDKGETSRDDSSDQAKPAKRSRRRKQRQKKAAEAAALLQMDSQSQQLASDHFDSIIWCTVCLKVQAELEHNERLYVVGANPELGGWDLSLALPLLESEEDGVWQNTLKIPRSTMLEYKYFTESQDPDSAIIERWFGPEIQYFLPWKEGQGSEVELIRDTWVPDIPTKLPLLSWGDRWWEEIDSVDNGEDSGGYKVQVLDREYQQIDSGELVITEEEPLVPERNIKTPVEQLEPEEWLKKKIRRKVFPREEPWLLESMIMEQRNGAVRKKAVDVEATGEGTEGGTETLEAEQDSMVQVEILINSPQCTMQRMAILENGKLVELLLEPVNTRVQVGNVYLGVVKQLLPGMTGVFIDIGGFQLALLDITRNQYPYTFPSIGQSSAVPNDGDLWDSPDDEDESDWEEGSASEDEDDEEDDVDEHEGDCAEDEEEGEDGELDEEEEGEENTSRQKATHPKGRAQDGRVEDQDAKYTRSESRVRNLHPMGRTDFGSSGPITVNFGRKLKKWRKLQEGMQIIVQVKKEALGKKGPRLTAFPSLAGRFWVLIPGGRAVGVSRRITGPERKRLRQLAQELLPTNFSLTVRTEALGHDREELEKDLARLLEIWKEVLESASAAAVAAEHGLEGAVPVLLHRAMGQTLSLVRDFFNNKVHRMVIDSPQCYQEVTSYLQDVAPHLSDRVELYTDKTPIFDAFDIEHEIEKFSSRRVSLPNGGYLVMEETEALVSIDVNGGTGVLSHDVSQEEAILGVNLAAARQIATELRLRDIGGIIVVDFIDMEDPKDEKRVLDEMRKATSRDRSSLALSEISEFGLMQMTRKRVRPSVTLTISDPCSHCGGVGRVEAHETTLSKIERAVQRLLATRPGQANSLDSAKWPQLILRVDPVMGEYLKGRKRKRMTQLSAALKVWLNLKVALEFSMGHFQVLEQHRQGSEKRSNGAAHLKSNQQTTGPSLLGKRGVLPGGKRRRNFASQVSSKVS